ncbi:MAG: hypothetical protein D6812_09000, partial [Deltaproteobacteria bacterium]
MKRLLYLSIALFVASFVMAPQCGGGGKTLLVVVNQGAQNLSQIDLATGEVSDLCPNIRLGTQPNAITIDDGRAYVTNAGSDTLQVIDLSGCALVASIELPRQPVRCEPWESVVITQTDPAGNEVKKAYTTCFMSSTVQVSDLQTNEVVTEIRLPGPDQFHSASPKGIAVFGTKAFVANTGLNQTNFTYGAGTISVIDIETDTIVDVDDNSNNGNETPMTTTQKNPQGMDIDGAGTLFTACTGNFTTLQPGLVDSHNTTSYSPIFAYETDGTPASVAIADNGKGFAGEAQGGKVYVFDTFARSVLRG